MKLSSVLLVLTLTTAPVYSEYKRWMSDTNFENPANWNVKRVPCGNDVVLIPEESPVVFVQLNTTLKELILPKSGEIILGKNTKLMFTDQPSDECPDSGGDVEFTAVNPFPWLSPSSWCSSVTERGQCDVTNIRLDVEQVPCTYDDVIFPPDHSFFVDLTDAASKVTVKSLKISGTTFSSTSFTSYLSNPIGQRMFKTTTGGTTPLDVTRKACDDPRGCACGNDRKEIVSEICKHVEKKCKRPRCKNTIQPVGSCCRMCGAVFNITRGYGFNFNDFKKIVKTKFFSDQKNTGVNMMASVTSSDWVQLVVADLTGEKSIRLARRIKADFDSDLSSGGHRYAIDGVQLSLVTGSSIGPKTSANTGQQMGGGSIVGIFFAVVIALIVLIAVVVIFVYKRQGKPLPRLPPIPKLPPMPRLPRIPQLPRILRRQGRAFVRGPGQPQTAPHVDPGFANPLYDSSPFDDNNTIAKEMDLIGASQEVQPTFDASEGGFNNPLYGAHGGMMIGDASEVDTGVDAVDSATPTEPTVTLTSPTTPTACTTIILVDTGTGEAPDSTI